MRLRFNLRDLLWLVVVVALAVGWGLERQKWTGLEPLLFDPGPARAALYQINKSISAQEIEFQLTSALNVEHGGRSHTNAQISVDVPRNFVIVSATSKQQDAIKRFIQRLDPSVP